MIHVKGGPLHVSWNSCGWMYVHTSKSISNIFAWSVARFFSSSSITDILSFSCNLHHIKITWLYTFKLKKLILTLKLLSPFLSQVVQISGQDPVTTATVTAMFVYTVVSPLIHSSAQLWWPLIVSSPLPTALLFSHALQVQQLPLLSLQTMSNRHHTSLIKVHFFLFLTSNPVCKMDVVSDNLLFSCCSCSVSCCLSWSSAAAFSFSSSINCKNGYKKCLKVMTFQSKMTFTVSLLPNHNVCCHANQWQQPQHTTLKLSCDTDGD